MIRKPNKNFKNGSTPKKLNTQAESFYTSKRAKDFLLPVTGL